MTLEEQLPRGCPIEAASKRTSDALETLSNDLMSQLGRSGKKLTSEEELLGAAATKVRDTLQTIQEDLRGMKSPEGIIEIKLAPFVNGVTKALREQTKSAGEQTEKLQSIIGKLEEAIRSLSEGLQRAGSQRATEMSSLEAVVLSTQKISAETKEVVSSLNDKLIGTQAEKSRLFPWIGGRQ